MRLLLIRAKEATWIVRCIKGSTKSLYTRVEGKANEFGGLKLEKEPRTEYESILREFQVLSEIQSTVLDDAEAELFVLSIQPAALSSIGVQVTYSDAQPSILQQTCLKRLLVGHVLCNNANNSMKLLDMTVNIHLSEATMENNFWILPSTRITIEALLKQPAPPRSPNPTAQMIQQALETPLSVPTCRKFLLYGPPGVGKTFAVRQALLPGTKLVTLEGSSWDPSILSSMNDDALVFWDECDALFTPDSRLGARFLQFLDTTSSVVVAATNYSGPMDDSVRLRFDKQLHMAPPTEEERLQILTANLEHHEISKDELESLARVTVGYVAADLVGLVRRGLLLFNGQDEASLMQYLQEARKRVPASALRSVKPPSKSMSWGDICGDAGGAKKILQRALNWPGHKMGIPPPRGILLYGPPGCAKTSLARAAASAAHVAFVSLSPAEVYSSSYTGQAEAKLRDTFALARSVAPCILFFDEIDALVETKGGLDRGTAAEARVLSTFLNEMDGVDVVSENVLVLGATNRPWTLDAALLRPGRFDSQVLVPPPDRETRRALFESFLRQWEHGQVSCEEIDVDALASVSELMTGAEISGACRRAAMDCIQRGLSNNGDLVMTQANLLDALEEISPLLVDPSVMKPFLEFGNLKSA